MGEYSPIAIIARQRERVLMRRQAEVEAAARLERDRAAIAAGERITPDRWQVRQFTPAVEFELPKKDGPKALPVVGRYSSGG